MRRFLGGLPIDELPNQDLGRLVDLVEKGWHLRVSGYPAPLVESLAIQFSVGIDAEEGVFDALEGVRDLFSEVPDFEG